ncbi:TolC family protein [Hymenobacter arizonensis]|uniref:Outer membrane protein, cobalt-zinc-cadmium efflux system n=1 Tax=Hymenobacter arizonensis TaxID=1227077 RepID=A0A1I5ZB40_HYMAR|nr:TolC family protein [Hymenobacter arizonensis]SFQ53701.1 outer membrane protein, cobalt-zinc-cadmium efflux system [Hymenobacter arizonensis]
MQKYLIFNLISVGFLLLGQPVSAQTTLATPITSPLPTDTLRLTLAEAEQRFLSTNYALLAQKFNVSAAQAQELQASLFDNPEISVERNAYNPYRGRFFESNEERKQWVATYQQLLLLGGKRRKNVEYQRLGTEIEGHNFNDLVRTLQYELRTGFVRLYYRQQTLGVYQQQREALQRTLTIYQAQLNRGNVALKEVVRLKAALFSLESERKELVNEISELQASLNLLLGNRPPRVLLPVLPANPATGLRLAALPLAQALEVARSSRPDLRAAETTTRQEQQNLLVQKALAVPDLTVGGLYDYNGAVGKNYTGITVGMPLPLFNRNQGNIRSAQAQIQASEQALNQQATAVETEVAEAYAKAAEAERLATSFPTDYFTDFDKLLDGVLTSYQRKAIGTLEFLDFLESYKDNMVQLNEARADQLNSFENLNQQLGRRVFAW